MVNSVLFVKTKETAIVFLESILHELNFNISKKEEVNKGLGLKYYLLKNSKTSVVIVYFNIKSLQSTKIVFEKINDEDKHRMIKRLDNEEVNDTDDGQIRKRIPIYASIFIDKDADRAKLKEAFNGIKAIIYECEKKEYID